METHLIHLQSVVCFLAMHESMDAYRLSYCLFEPQSAVANTSRKRRHTMYSC